ncbi:hypothetical protein IAI18_14370 [Acetobacteraceae bacterium H6797]|nr:hypothetical protein [Acetobacteraceae bacterium H6797]
MTRKFPPLSVKADGDASCGDALCAGILPEGDDFDELALTRQLDAWMEQAFEPVWAPIVWPRLMGWCAELKARLPPERWMLARLLILSHDISLLAQEDPWTRVCGELRGERMVPPGLVDLAIEHASTRPLMEQASTAGRAIHDVLTALPLALALRDQQRMLARLAETMAERDRSARFLTLDAGYLREAGLMQGEKTILHWFAQESHAESMAKLVAHIKSAPSRLASIVRPRSGIGQLLRDRPGKPLTYQMIAMPRSLARLNDRQAKTMLAMAFSRLAPGGVLIASSIMPDLPEAAYLETFAGWAPRCRDEAAAAALIEELPAEECLRREVIVAPSGGMVHLVLVRGF